MAKYVVILIHNSNNVVKLLRKLSKHGKISYAVLVVDVEDPRVLGGFVSQYKARVLRNFVIYPLS